jgi:hypothetical protein
MYSDDEDIESHPVGNRTVPLEQGPGSRRPRSSQRGASLLEYSIVIGLLGIGTVVTVSSFGKGYTKQIMQQILPSLGGFASNSEVGGGPGGEGPGPDSDSSLSNSSDFSDHSSDPSSSSDYSSDPPSSSDYSSDPSSSSDYSSDPPSSSDMSSSYDSYSNSDGSLSSYSDYSYYYTSSDSNTSY